MVRSVMVMLPSLAEGIGGTGRGCRLLDQRDDRLALLDHVRGELGGPISTRSWMTSPPGALSSCCGWMTVTILTAITPQGVPGCAPWSAPSVTTHCNAI